MDIAGLLRSIKGNRFLPAQKNGIYLSQPLGGELPPQAIQKGESIQSLCRLEPTAQEGQFAIKHAKEMGRMTRDFSVILCFSFLERLPRELLRES